MIKKTLIGALLIAFTMSLMSFELPFGWFKAGSKPGNYEMGIDAGAGRNGNNAATIKSKKTKVKGFGTLMQNCLPDKFRGKRVRMSGYIKTVDVTGWTGFWFRVDKKNSKGSLAFDNMSNRKIKGTTEWTRYEIVLDVPDAASNLAYGVLITGAGQVWFDELKFEIVDDTAKTTGDGYKTHSEPTNLDFEK